MENCDLEQNFVDIKKVEKIKQEMTNEETIFEMAEFCKVFGDSTRMKIISALLKDELCVSEIAIITNSTRLCNFTSTKSIKTGKTCKI